MAKRKSPGQPTNHPVPDAGERRDPRAAELVHHPDRLSGNWASHHDRATACQRVRRRRTPSGILRTGITACPEVNLRMNPRRTRVKRARRGIRSTKEMQ
jgi:hypothetical protein